MFVRGCRGGTGAEDRGGEGRVFEVGLCLSGNVGRDWCGGPWEQGQAFEVGLCLSGDVGEGVVRRTVAGRAERSRSDFVCPGSTDVIGDAAVLAGFLCQRRANVAGNFVNFIKFRQYDERKNRKIFDEKMSGKGVEADLSGQGKNAQRGRCPRKPASRGKTTSQLNGNGQLSNGPTKPPCRGKSASQLNANGQLSNGPTKRASRGKSASQLNPNEQLPKCSTKAPRKEKSA